MAGIRDYNSSPALNTTIRGINISEGMDRNLVNDALRAQMADAKDFADEHSVFQVKTFALAIAAQVHSSIDIVRTGSRITAGDGGGASYVRWVTGMTALVLNQQGYSWFASADGAQWTLSEAVIRPEMFGAIGHATNDEGLAIRRMFEVASGKEVLITKTHRYKSVVDGVDTIRIYSNTKVQGVSALTCGFKRIPNLTTDTLSGYGIFWQDADEIEINDIFHDVQRSGLGEALARRVNGFLCRGKNGRIRLNRLRVLNATGYAFYVSAVTTDFTSDYVATDCIAINSQVSFEVTGAKTNARFIRPQSLQYVTDGGAIVPPECGYHQYGGIAGAYHEKPFHRGAAPAVLAVMVEDGATHSGVVYDDPDFEISLPGIATVIVRNDYYSVAAHPGNGKRAQADFINGRVVNLNGPASDFTTSLVDIDGTQFIGRTAALSVGAFSIVSLNGDFDVQCIEPVTTNVGTAALGAVIDNTAVCTRTPSGSVSATHLNGGATTAVSGVITLVSDTVFTPALGGGPVGTEYPRVIQRKKGFRVVGTNGATDIIDNGGNTYWTSIVLDSIPSGWTTASQNTDWDKVRVIEMHLELAGQTGVVVPVQTTIQKYRRPAVMQGEVFFTFTASAALPAGTRFRFNIEEIV